MKFKAETYTCNQLLVVSHRLKLYYSTNTTNKIVCYLMAGRRNGLAKEMLMGYLEIISTSVFRTD